MRDPHDYTADDMAEVLLTNFVGCLCLIHAVLPLLEKNGNRRIVNVSSGFGSFKGVHDRIPSGAFVRTPLCAALKAAINMMTVHFARLLRHVRINVADPGLTATDLSGGQGHSVHGGTDAVIACALIAPGGPTGTFADRDSEVPW
jgi:NAD(P)-dependent dehydrogenase (short-subunit alcohol dehydrogenase family)